MPQDHERAATQCSCPLPYALHAASAHRPWQRNTSTALLSVALALAYDGPQRVQAQRVPAKLRGCSPSPTPRALLLGARPATWTRNLPSFRSPRSRKPVHWPLGPQLLHAALDGEPAVRHQASRGACMSLEPTPPRPLSACCLPPSHVPHDAAAKPPTYGHTARPRFSSLAFPWPRVTSTHTSLVHQIATPASHAQLQGIHGMHQSLVSTCVPHA